MTDLLAIGRIRSPHGVAGVLKVTSYSGETVHFMRLREVTLASDGKQRTFEVEKVTCSGESLYLKLTGLNSPEEGKRFSNWEILAPRAEAAELHEGEYYHADLCGCALVKEGRVLGTILAVCEGGASDLLEVATDRGLRRLVPFQNQFIGTVDLRARTIELKEEWLLQ